MNMKTYQIPLKIEQILYLVQQLSESEKEQLKQELNKQSSIKEDQDILSVFARISKNARDKGLTEEILEELLAEKLT